MSTPLLDRETPVRRPRGAGFRHLLRFRSIKAKLTFCLLAVSVIPILFLSYVAFRTAKQEIRQEVLGHLSGAVSLKRDSIQQWYQERRAQAALVPRDPDFAAQSEFLLHADFESRHALTAYDVISRHIRPYISQDGYYDEIFLMNMAGQVIYSTNPGQEGTYKSNRLYFKEGTHALYIQNMYHSITLGRTTSTIALPIPSGEDPVGVLAFRLRVDRLHEIMRSYAGLEPEGDMYLVNNQNYFATDPAGQTGYAMERVNYSEPVRRCLDDHGGADEMVSWHGGEVLAAFLYMPEYRMCIIGEVATEAAYRSVRHMQRFMVILTGSTLAAVMLIAFFVSTSISRPIVELTALTTRAATGDMDQAIESDLRDELGTLARSFNTMLANLRQRTQELARSNADLEEFAYVVSHDLKEPLRSVSGFVELLNRRYREQLDPTARGYIDRSLAGAERMKALIDDLLLYARTSTGPRTLQRVDTSAVVQDVLSALAKSIREAEARVEVGSLPVIQAEPPQIARLFQNLIANAIKFRRDEPPVIRISAEVEPGARPDEEAWRFSVQDNGIGIESQYAERVFQVFKRLHAQDEYPGTGIGLSICKKIAERHGGRIWLESEPGAGTTFHFTIAHRRAAE
jgi:signal transduction histidine kinase